MKLRHSPYEKELAKLSKQEMRYIGERVEKKDSALNRLLAEKVPEKLQETLDTAFAKAFGLVFEKGRGVIELSYNKEEREKQFSVDEFAAKVKGDRKSLRNFSKKAVGYGRLNLAISGAAGIGLGVLGIGLPDIALFTGLMLKSIYEIALNYGFEYDSEEEKAFILRIIYGAVSYGQELKRIDGEINDYIDSGAFPAEQDCEALIKQAASGLSGELLYMKFLQGIPLVGVVGGACDAVYMKNIIKYAELKYRRRFYTGIKK